MTETKGTDSISSIYIVRMTLRYKDDSLYKESCNPGTIDDTWALLGHTGICRLFARTNLGDSTTVQPPESKY